MLYYLLLTPSIILIVAAVIPAIVLLRFTKKQDKLEPESPRLLLDLVLRGVYSAVLAGILETVGFKLLELTGIPQNSYLYLAIMYVGIVAFAEEGSKYFFLNRRTWEEPEYNCRFDGIMYAVFVSLGFALWENIRYVLAYGFSTALVRACTAVPGHACFGVFMGLFYGQAKQWLVYGNKERAAFCKRMAVFVPALLHGAYDFLASIGFDYLFIVFVVIMFIIAYRTVKRSAAEDQYIV